MVDGVGDDHGALVEQGQPLRLAERGRPRRTVGEAARAGAEPPYDALPVRGELHQSVPGGVADQEVSGRQHQGLAREAQGGRLGLGRHIRPVAAPQGALRAVLGLQLRHQPLDRVHMPLTGVLRDHVPLRVDHHERRPGADRVLLPGRELRVVEDGMPDAVPLHGVRHRRVLRLVRELRRVHTDHHDGVGVLLLQRPELVEDVQAVHTAKGPEVEDDDAAPQVGEGVPLPARVQPAALADQLGGPDADAAGCGSAHGPRVPPGTDSQPSVCPVVTSTWSGTSSWRSPTVEVPVGSSRRMSVGTGA